VKGSPFTRLCQSLVTLRAPARADLHLHTTFSDGTHTPAGLVDRARKAGLAAIAVTDHDTTAGVEPTRRVAGPGLEVIAGVEITAEFRGSELHLLGYFIDPDDPALAAALVELRQARRARAVEMARRLTPRGASIEAAVSAIPGDVSVGRRHLARLLIEAGHAWTLHGAFTRWLSVPEVAGVPKKRLPVADAISLVRGAGGVASWAHPPADADLDAMRGLGALGLGAVECVYPWPTRAHGDRLRAMAASLGLAVTGGSDSHDPGPAGRAVGARAVTLDEVAKIRARTPNPLTLDT
jgi:predicted metal-dependent phosphoesterase TrpH